MSTTGAVALLEDYSAGRYTAVADALGASQSIDGVFADLKAHAPGWTDSGGPADAPRRRLIAAALSLEAVHASLEREPTGPEPGSDVVDAAASAARRDSARLQLLAWGSALVQRDSALPSAAAEREYDLALMAGVEEFGAFDDGLPLDTVWAELTGHPLLTGPAGRAQSSFGRGGVIGEALARFSDEPRLRLAQVEGDEYQKTICDWRWCLAEATPSVLDDLRRRQQPPTPIAPGGEPTLRSLHPVTENLQVFDAIPGAAAEFEGLTTDPTVRAEADVHVGYLAIRIGQYSRALASLAMAADSDESHVRYLAAYLRGRALEALGRHADAIAAYREALTAVPGARAASTLLAAQLFLSDRMADRSQASVLLDTLYRSGSTSPDPWRSYWLGDARLWRAYIVRLREVLR